ncbi:IS3 family transposase [Flavobacterium daemonense]|uniref:IS3 family transposase n=1 Tax=Flavobacterium daemonense TaxID=1393049 RepID=UPI0011847DB5|nr:IS3 family transposase [Flavobacterium daemonense]KAF2333782.1 IS3 family transposase [Flavobacterium daemonense]
MNKNSRHYDPVFKENAVLLSYVRNTVSETANELGVNPKMLSKWRSTYSKFAKGSFPGLGRKRVYYENKEIYELEKNLADSRIRLEILEKGQKYMHQGKHVLCNFIHQNRDKYPLYKMFEVLRASHSTYDLWTKQPFSKTETRVYLLKKEIKSIFFEFEQYKGVVFITRELHDRGFQISEGQVSFWLKELGLRSKVKKKFKITTNSQHNLCIAPNILNRQFKVDKPSKVWVSDITYIQIDKRFSYLTVVMDLYDRKIIGWHLSSGLSTKVTTLPAFEKAITNRAVTEGLIFHSDKGIQYANKLFTNKLVEYNCKPSMSRTGDSYDNAVMESFFNTLKREAIYKQKRLLTTSELKIVILEYIENWYNKKRIHSSLNYKSPEEFNNISHEKEDTL